MKTGSHLSADLSILARRSMLQNNLIPDFPPEVVKELQSINTPALLSPSEKIKDLRGKLWFSIDNDDSLDLDQLTFAEKISPTESKIYIAIADVDALVKKGMAIDIHAEKNTTSIYTPSKVFPMLPEKLSTNLTSLNENEDRLVVIAEVLINKNGWFDTFEVYPAFVRNYAKLTYNNIGAWLENHLPIPEKVVALKGLDEQIILQDRIAQQIKEYRQHRGALSFETMEPQPVIVHNEIVDLKEIEKNRARDLIENFMITANAAITLYLIKHKFPTFRRIVRIPKRWERIVELAKPFGENLPINPDSKALEAFLLKRRQADPSTFPDLSLAIIKLLGRGEYLVEHPGEPPVGHFALALSEYSHATAPNRRYPDLVIQRLLKALFTGKEPPYSYPELEAIARNCTDQETAAEKVKRSLIKSAAGMILSSHLNEVYDAMVTGAGPKGTWVRIYHPTVEGRLIQGFEGLDVGDRIKAKLVHVDIDRGYIDFIRGK